MDDFDWGDWLGDIESGLDLSGGDTSWLDNFDWGSALDNLDFSNLDLSNVVGDVGAGGLDALLNNLEGFDLETADQVYGGSDLGTGLSYYAGEGYGTGDAGGMAGAEDLIGDKDNIFGGDDGAGTIVVTGKKDDETKSILDDEEHVRTDVDVDKDKDVTSILTDEEHTRQFDEDSFLKKLLDALKPKGDNAALYAMLGGLLGLMNRRGGSSAPVGYQGTIPKYTATRGPSRSPTAGGRRPGGAGIGSLTGGVTFTPVGAAGGGLMGLAGGGRPARYLRGGTDGMADKIQTDIDGKQPARLSHGEFVIPADVVSHLGNGNSDAGADVLYDMMAKVRKARTGNSKQGKQINPRKYTPV